MWVLSRISCIAVTMIQKTAFKGLPLSSCLPEIGRMFLYCGVTTLLSILVLWRKRTLA